MPGDKNNHYKKELDIKNNIDKYGADLLEMFFSQSLDGIFFMMIDEPVHWDDTADKEKVLDYVFKHQRMTKVNQALLDQYRTTADKFIGLTPFDLFKHDQEHGRQIWRGLFDQGRWHVETNEKRLDGTEMLVLGDYICMYDEKGRITGHFGIQADITERKAAEDSLFQSEARYRSLVEESSDLICRWLPDMSLSYVNRAYCRYFNKKSEELLGTPWVELLPEKIRDKVHRKYKIYIAQETVFNYEYQVPGIDGQLFWQEWINVPVFNIDGKLIEYQSSGRDITERKKAEHQLQEKEARLQRQREATARLFLDEVVNAGDISAVLRQVTRILAETIDVERASVWGLSEDGTGLKCLSLYEAASGEYSAGMALKTADFPAYFAAIYRENRIYAEDAQNDPRTRELTPVYLAPLGITSMLDAGIMIEGSLAGVVCLEHIGKMRRWHSDEEAFVTTAASIVAQTMINIKQKQAEEELKNSHQRLLVVLDSIEAIIYVAAMDTYELLFINKYAKSVWGNITGKKCWEHIQAGQKGPCEFCTNDRLLDAEGRPTGVYRWEFKTRKGRWFDCQDTALRWFDGRMVRLEMATDITGRKEMEEALRESEEQFRMLVDNFPDGIIVLYDREFRCLFAAGKGLEEIGVSKDVLVGKRPRDIFPGDFCEVLEKNLFAAFNGEKTSFEITWNKRHYMQMAIPFRKKDEITEIMGVIFDITERKKAEEALIKSENDYAETCRQLNEEMNKAEDIHNRILPAVIPELDGISIATHYQPAQKMGGDCYNIIKSEHQLIIYLSDVMGHGLDGAMISVFVKETIDNYIMLKPDELEPQLIIRHLHKKFMRENYPDEQLICIFLGVLDLNTLNFSYVNAGFQTRPLLKIGQGERRRLEGNGLFISCAVPYELFTPDEYNLTLTPGATMLISTDGMPEQSNGKEWYYEYYEDIFYRNSHLPPEIIIKTLNNDFCLFNNNTLTGNDDITFLVLQVNRDKINKHHLKINSRFAELEALYSEISALLAGFKVNSNLMICLHEIIANAIEHGNKLDPDKKVLIDLTITPQYVLAEVEDEGEGFNWQDKIDMTMDLEIFSVRGRGIPVIRLLAGHLYYNQQGNRATLLLEA